MPGTLTGGYAILSDVNDHRGPRYFEDYVPGLTVDCGSFTMSEADIIAFAKEYDPQPFHVDPVAAKDGPYGGLIASGWHTTSMMMRRLVEHFVSPESGLGAAGVDEIRWPRPVLGPPKGNFLGWPVAAVPTAFLNGRGDFDSD